MTEARGIAYTGDDLIEIGRIVKRVTKRLGAFESYSGSNVEDAVDNINIDIVLDGDIVGHLAYEDGWIGFFPHTVSGVRD